MRILLIVKEPIGEKMNAMGIRYFEFAKFLAQKNETVLLSPFSDNPLSQHGFKHLSFSYKELFKQIKKADVLIAVNPHPLALFLSMVFNKKVILDLYDPVPIENLDLIDSLKAREKKELYKVFMSWVRLQIKTSCHYLYAHQRQKDFWLGVLASWGRLSPNVYEKNKMAKTLFSLAPTGVKNAPLEKNKKVLRGVVPTIEEKDTILLWLGAPNRWFNPELLIKAMAVVAQKNSHIKLVFGGGKIENNEILKKNLELSDSLGLTNKTIYFLKDWIGYEELDDYYLESDIGISLHHQNLESYFSMRNRIVGYFGGGLPVIVSFGDYLSEVVKEKNLGLVIEKDEVKELAKTILELAQNKELYSLCKKNVEEIKKEMAWPKVLESLNGALAFTAESPRPRNFFGFFALSADLLFRYLFFILKYGRKDFKQDIF